jgi:ATP-binding cassette subfamily F protein 3
MISHDRTFLDKITNRTLEITNGRIEDYKASYSNYLILRKERREKLESAARNQGKQIAQMERNIERFKAKASKASFAQSLMKKLDKIDRIEVDMEDVSKISIRFPEPPRAGKVIVTGEHIQKNYGDKKVISPMSFSIDRGDRIAFVGKNGMGKTTLSRIIAKDLDFEGDLNYGHNIHLGYFAQHQANKLNGENTILKEMESAAYGSDTFTQVRSILGAFLFSGEDVDKKVKVLSGGEKSRLSMAKLLLEPLNFLIFDEPTNHLDIVSKDVLKNAILNFDGTIIIVSHDRDFLKGLTNKIFEFTKEGIKQHLGDINEFLSKKNAENFRDFELSKEKKKEEKQAVEIKEQASPQKDKELKRIKNAIANAEKKIAELESQIQQMDQQLQNEVEFKKIGNNPAFFQRYDELKNQLESEMHKWEELLREADTPI